jgi:hypothetical protein
VQFLLKRLVHLYNLQSEEPTILKVFDALTHECLSYPTTEKLPQFSLICGDFTPIQFSVALSGTQREGTALRYVTEVTKPFMLLPARVELGRRRIPVLLELIDAEHLEPIIQSMLELLLPKSRLSPNYPKFGFWIGVQHKKSLGTSLEIYCNLLWELGNPWSLSYETLKLLDRLDFLRLIVDARKSLRHCCQPNSIGLQFDADGFKMVRLYLRGYQLRWSSIHSFFKKMGLTHFENELNLFNRVFLNGRRTCIPHSTILSIGSPWEPQGFCGVKVEIGPRYYAESDETVRRRITELNQELMLDIKPYKQMLDLFSNGALTPGTIRFHDVVGVSFKPQMGTGLNIYLRPDLPHHYKTA